MVPTRTPEEEGLLPVPPGHSISCWLVGTPLRIPRKLDISLAGDRVFFQAFLPANSELQELSTRYLDDYLSLFPESHWRQLYGGGMIAVPCKATHQAVYSIHLLLAITRELLSLSHYRGYPALLEGFRNPSQVPSAIFEVEAAAWCRCRKLTVGLEFSPKVERGTHTKLPDFLWKTEFGDLFCECKQANEFEAKIQRAYNRLNAALESAYGPTPWDMDLRLDVSVISTNQEVPEHLKDLVDAASRHKQLGQVPWNGDPRIAAVIRKRSDRPPHQHGSMVGFRLHSSDVERQVGYEEADYSLTLDIAGMRKRLASHLLRVARSQLPPDRASAVFLSLGDIVSARDKVKELMEQPSYSNTRFVWIRGEHGQPRVLTRPGQPFDQRLTEERRVVPQIPGAPHVPVDIAGAAGTV